MREIKFRGYSTQELVTDSQWINNGYGVTTIEDINGKTSTHIITPYGDYQVFKKSVGQYTGLKDKNGVEIYEGDILKRNGNIYEVIFNKACFKVSNIKYRNANLYLLGEMSLDKVEIIGNIYENPELLEIK